MLRRVLPVLIAVMALAPAAAADVPNAPPPAPAAVGAADAQTKAAIEKQRLRFAAAMRPEFRTRVLSAARLLDQRLDAPVPPGGRPLDALQSARQIVTDGQSFSGIGGPSGDIEAVVFIVLMEATKSSEDDLQSIMAQVKATDAAKACLRASADRAVARRCMDAIVPTPPVTQAALDTLLGPAKVDPGALADMSQMLSQRLQMTMDRISKLMATLSNVLKKISDTDSSIVQNLK